MPFAFQGGTNPWKGFFPASDSDGKKYNCNGVQASNVIQTNGNVLDEGRMDIFYFGYFLMRNLANGTKELRDSCRKTRIGEAPYDNVTNGEKKLRAKGIDHNVQCVVNQYIAQQPRTVFEGLS